MFFRELHKLIKRMDTLKYRFTEGHRGGTEGHRDRDF